MRECWHRATERLKNLNLHRRVTHMILTAQHMADLHVDIIHRTRQHVSIHAIFAYQNRVAHMRHFKALAPANTIFPRDVFILI